METNIVVIVLMGLLATQASRLAPIFLFSKRDLSPRFERWMQHLPIAILSALIVPEFFEKAPQDQVHLNGTYALAGGVCLLVGLKSRNLVTTTLTGVAVTSVLRFLATPA